ncbi:MAG: hypothetical protein PVG66_12875 [Chromatiales bacterium]|jgi:hypothetical protein
MEKNIVDGFIQEFSSFKSWADQISDKDSPDWSDEYNNWASFEKAVSDFISNVEIESLSDLTIEGLIFSIARDHEDEIFIEQIVKNKPLFQKLIPHVIDSDEYWAKVEIAEWLGKNVIDTNESENYLLELLERGSFGLDTTALTSLGKIAPILAEEKAIEFWESKLLYKKYAALDVLSRVNSGRYSHYFKEACMEGWLDQKTEKLTDDALKALEEERKALGSVRE